MKGYWLILGTEVTDQAAHGEYNRLWAPIAEKFQALINPTRVPPLLKEARNTARVIIFEFPSYEIARPATRIRPIRTPGSLHCRPRSATCSSLKECSNSDELADRQISPRPRRSGRSPGSYPSDCLLQLLSLEQ